MKKYFLAVASFFIYSHISLGQVYPGRWIPRLSLYGVITMTRS